MNSSLKIELCGKLADSYGPLVTIEAAPNGFAVKELMAAVGQAYPLLQPELASGRILACVNEAIVPEDAIIRPGDIAALFPPVSGG